MKYQFITEQCSEFGVERMCRVLGVSRSGYYSHKRYKSKREQENELLLEQIRKIHKKSRQTYGSPRITDELYDNNIRCSKNRVARLMRKNGIMAKMKRKFKVTTHSRHTDPVADNLLQQKFTTAGANKVWVSDITYIWTSEGWLYLCAILDLFSRRIIAWGVSERLTSNLVTDALLQAIWHRKVEKGILFHSDRGSQYASSACRDTLKKHGLIQSMSGKGNCYDNAVMESFFHTLKTEMVYFERFRTRREAKQCIFEYIEVFYNRQRKHSAINYKSPTEFENMALAA
jgi:transposase InsO family protein